MVYGIKTRTFGQLYVKMRRCQLNQSSHQEKCDSLDLQCFADVTQVVLENPPDSFSVIIHFMIKMGFEKLLCGVGKTHY